MVFCSFLSFLNKTIILKETAILECSISQFEMSKHVSKSHIQKYFNHSLKNSKHPFNFHTPYYHPTHQTSQGIGTCKTFSSIFLYYSLYQEKFKVITFSHLKQLWGEYDSENTNGFLRKTTVFMGLNLWAASISVGPK